MIAKPSQDTHRRSAGMGVTERDRAGSHTSDDTTPEAIVRTSGSNPRIARLTSRSYTRRPVLSLETQGNVAPLVDADRLSCTAGFEPERGKRHMAPSKVMPVGEALAM
jgi:hypothetical protein